MVIFFSRCASVHCGPFFRVVNMSLPRENPRKITVREINPRTNKAALARDRKSRQGYSLVNREVSRSVFFLVRLKELTLQSGWIK
jgi:hypothetical protein